jgi:hypothetical protein
LEADKQREAEAWEINVLTGEGECYETIKTLVLSDGYHLVGLLDA